MAEPGPPRRSEPRPAPVPFRARSRLVAWAKILLPLAALALLSTVFLLAREEAGPAEIPFARIEEIAREPRIDRPRLAGVAPDGTVVALAADRIVPVAGAPDRFALEAPRLETEDPEGARAELAAGAGEVDGRERRLVLSGGVRARASGGWALETEAVEADLDTGRLAAGAVRGTGPFGTVEAGGLVLTQGEGKDARLVFHDGVRLLYEPEDPSSPEAAP